MLAQDKGLEVGRGQISKGSDNEGYAGGRVGYFVLARCRRNDQKVAKRV